MSQPTDQASLNQMGLIEFHAKYRGLYMHFGMYEGKWTDYDKFNAIGKSLTNFVQKTYSKQDIACCELPRNILNEFHDYLLNSEGMRYKDVVYTVELLDRMIDAAEIFGFVDDYLFENYVHSDYIREVYTLSISEVEGFHIIDVDSSEEDIVRDAFLFSCYTGLTLGEIKAATIDDLVLVDCALWINVTRENIERCRRVPLLEEARKLIVKYSKARKDKQTNKLFPVCFPSSMNPILKKLAEAIGTEREISFETGRFTFATTIGCVNHIPSSIVNQVYGISRVENNTEYQDILLFEHLYELEELLSQSGEDVNSEI